MNKLLTHLTACAFGLAVCGTAIAADQMSPEKETAPTAAQPATPEQPSGMTPEKDKATSSDPQAADKATKEDVNSAYTAALKKCASMTGADKGACEEKAKGERGKM